MNPFVFLICYFDVRCDFYNRVVVVGTALLMILFILQANVEKFLLILLTGLFLHFVLGCYTIFNKRYNLLLGLGSFFFYLIGFSLLGQETRLTEFFTRFFPSMTIFVIFSCRLLSFMIKWSVRFYRMCLFLLNGYIKKTRL